MKEELLRGFIREIWNEGKIDKIPEFVSHKYTVFHDPGDPWDGKELSVAQFQERVTVSRAPIPDQRFDIQELYENDESVCITWLWNGTHRGEIAGIAGTGKKLHMSGATVYYFANKRISGHWQIADRLGIFQQLNSS